MNSFFQDVRYALRTMRLNPGFTAVAILALALGIGANAAIFSVVNAVLLRPLPYPEASRLHMVVRQYERGNTDSITATNAWFWREHARSFAALTAYDVIGAGANLGGVAEPERIKSIRVTPEFWKVYGVMPALGRPFTAEEAKPNGPRVAVISDGLWRRRFGGDPNILGRAIALNAESWTVVGVMPPGFSMIPESDVWTPLPLVPSATDRANMLFLLGRLKPGVTPEQAQADSVRVTEMYKRAYPGLADDYRRMRLGPVPLQQMLFGQLRPALLMLLGAVALVLLIACANLANLLLARAAARDREIAVRTALGAGRLRLVRQLLTESVMLGLAGAALGLLLAYGGLRILLRFSPGEIPELARVDIDWRVLAFALAMAVVTAILFGLAPALQGIRVRLNEGLRAGGRGAAGTIRGNRMRSALIVAEVALSLVLLAGATLLMRSFWNLTKVDPGFDARSVLTMQMSLTGTEYQKTAGVASFARQVLRRMETVPGVQAAAYVTNLPTEQGPDLPFDVEGRKQTETGEAQYRVITADYFKVMGIAVRAGRTFAETDAENSAGVVIINETLAKQFFKGTNPIGERITIGKPMGPEFADRTRQVVGVVADVRELGLHQQPPPTLYVPLPQVPDALTAIANRVLPACWVLKAGGSPMGLAEPVRRELLAVNSQQPVSNVRAMEQVLGASLRGQRFNTLLLGLFAVLALVLSIVGIYGVMSYAVTQRTHEIGIRMALGASHGDAQGLIVRQAAWLTGAGVVLGLVCALALSRLIERLLFGVTHTDPATFAAAPVLLAASAMAASWIPARRATRVDPVRSLRYE